MALTNEQTIALDKKIREKYKEICIGKDPNHKLLVCKQNLIKIQKNGSIILQYDDGGMIKIPKGKILKVEKNTVTIVDGFALVLIVVKPPTPKSELKASPQCTPGSGSTCISQIYTEEIVLSPLPIMSKPPIPTLSDPLFDPLVSPTRGGGLLRGHRP